MNEQNKIQTNEDAFAAVILALREQEGVTTDIIRLKANVPAKGRAIVWVKVVPCPVSTWGGTLECQIDRKTGSVRSIDAGNWAHDEHEED